MNVDNDRTAILIAVLSFELVISVLVASLR